ncbi:MAG: membrane protein insertion efficiency factor YidD [Oscillospiraceae bacterium]|nr:membrane protein insertion efficiency factor YidD [Oscillospiraceae bacterium]
MKNLCAKLIEFYQKSISPYKPPCCRFDPVCSEYAKQAFLRHGVFWGFLLSAYRLLRCNPLGKAGYDPVPEKILTNKKRIKKNELN